MAHELARNLFHLMRTRSRATSLTRLRKTGHERVSILRYRDVETLIRQSVERTLASLGIELDKRSLKGLSDEARERFLALMTERDTLRETVDNLKEQKAELERHQAVLRGRVSETRASLADAEQAAHVEIPEIIEDLDTLEGRLAAALRELMADASSPRDLLAARAVELVSITIEEQRHLATERARAEHAERVDLLQRRLDKLGRKLEESETMLARARAAAGVAEDLPDDRELEPAGLSGGDPKFAQKKEVLDEIFQLNLELQRMMDEELD